MIDALEFALHCRRFNVLPKAGGLFDQDSYHMWILEIVDGAMRELEDQQRKRQQARAKP